MLVAVACDIASDDHRRVVYDLLAQYGFKRIHKCLFESTAIDDGSLVRLKPRPVEPRSGQGSAGPHQRAPRR